MYQSINPTNLSNLTQIVRYGLGWVVLHFGLGLVENFQTVNIMLDFSNVFNPINPTRERHNVRFTSDKVFLHIS